MTTMPKKLIDKDCQVRRRHQTDYDSAMVVKDDSPEDTDDDNDEVDDVNAEGERARQMPKKS